MEPHETKANFQNEVEDQPEQKSQKGYVTAIHERVTNKSFLAGSEYARHLDETELPYYQEQMEQAAKEFTETLKIRESFFENYANQEVFASLCDAWLANQNNKDRSEEEKQAESAFLIRFGRYLAGNDSDFNKEQWEQGSEGSENFITVPEKEEEEFHKLLTYMDEAKTSELITYCEQNDLFAGVREYFAIDGENEKPYQVLVIDAPRTQINGEWEEDEWGAAAFMCVDPRNGVSTIVMPLDRVNEIIHEQESALQSPKLLAHEYAHTQRSLRMGGQEMLGTILDESMVIHASKSGGHDTARLTVKALVELTDKKEFLSQFHQASRGPEQQAGLLRYISENFGHNALLRIMAIQPRGYEAVQGIGDIPGINLDKDARFTGLMSTIFHERQKINPQAVEHYHDNLVSLDANRAALLKAANGFARVKMPKINYKGTSVDLQQIIDEKAVGGDWGL